MVQQPGREITHQVSSPDLYRLFAEIAGADVAASIPANRPLDAQSMVASLTSPGQGAIRSLNFSEMGTTFNNPSMATTPQPCVVAARSEEQPSELPSLMRTSYADFSVKQK